MEKISQGSVWQLDQITSFFKLFHSRINIQGAYYIYSKTYLAKPPFFSISTKMRYLKQTFFSPNPSHTKHGHPSCLPQTPPLPQSAFLKRFLPSVPFDEIG